MPDTSKSRCKNRSSARIYARSFLALSLSLSDLCPGTLIECALLGVDVSPDVISHPFFSRASKKAAGERALMARRV